MPKASPKESSPSSRPERRALDELRRTVVALPADQALARILEHPLPATLVQSFPASDLHLLVREIGPGDAGPLLALAANAQIEFILDAESWNRDRIDNRALTEWFALLTGADAARMPALLARQHRDLVEYFLWRNVEVFVREHDQDPSDFPDDCFTLDGVFYLRLRGKAGPTDEEGDPPEAVEDRERFFQRFLDLLADHDYERFRDMLISATALLPAEHEEEALRRRTLRRAESGFLPFEEAVGIYQPIDGGALRAMGPKRFAWEDADGRPLPVPRFAADALPQRGAFARALAALAGRSGIERIEAEFAGLCNRLAVADKRVVRQRGELASLAAKAAGYIGIALEVTAGTGDRLDPGLGAALLERHSLEDLFRVGYREAAALKWRAERWQRRSTFRRWGLKLTFWDEGGMGVLGGLLLKRPLYFDNYRSGVLYRDFTDLDDVWETARILQDIERLDDLLGRMDLPADRLASARDLTWKNLWLTLWARARLGMSGTEPTIALADLRRFYAPLWTRRGRIRVAARRDFLGWLARSGGLSPETVSDTLAAVLENLFREIEDAYGRVRPEDLDRRYVHLFRVR